MKQPPGFESSDHPSHLCYLEKALYGLKQAPRAWHARLSSILCELGFKASKADMSLFFRCQQGVTMFLLVYVDDIIIISSTSSMADALIQQLGKAFAVKDLGKLHYFLGIEVHARGSSLTLTQKKYAEELLIKLRWISANRHPHLCHRVINSVRRMVILYQPKKPHITGAL